MDKLYWKAEDYKYKKKKVDWYWSLWIISLLLIISFYYFFEDYTFSILIFITAIIITFAGQKKPKIKKYLLDLDGLYINETKKRFLFKDIESYNIDLDNQKILLKFKNKTSVLVQIPFEKHQNISKIESILSQKLKKDETLLIPFLELLLNKILGF